MANNKSAKNRIQIAQRNKIQNKYYKSSFRTLRKNFFENLENYKVSKNLDTKKHLEQTLTSIYSFLDKGTKRNVFHKNMAARHKSRLAAHLKNI